MENYLQALEISANIFNEAKENDVPLKIMDIGGGFPIQHFDDEIGVNFERMAVADPQADPPALRQESSVHRRAGPLLGGAGRHSGDPGHRPARSATTRIITILNDGVYGDFSGMVFDHCKYEFKTLRRGQTFLSALAGPTCDSFDTLSLDVEIPELYVGDVVYVKNIGAYSSASAVANLQRLRSRQNRDGLTLSRVPFSNL